MYIVSSQWQDSIFTIYRELQAKTLYSSVTYMFKPKLKNSESLWQKIEPKSSTAFLITQI